MIARAVDRAAALVRVLVVVASLACTATCDKAGDIGSNAATPVLGSEPESKSPAASVPASDDPENEPAGGPFSSDAKHDTQQMLREDIAAVRHPSDGAGTVSLISYGRVDGSPGPLRASDYARFDFVFEAGPLGIEVGGELHFQVSSFWRWDNPQNVDPDRPGFTEVQCDAAGVEISPEWHGTELLAIGIGGRRLEAGEQVRISYGAGKVGARIDVFAERGAQLLFAVDGDGDGIRKFIHDVPRIDIISGEAARLLVMLPTSLEPGESFQAVVSILDQMGSAGVPFVGRVEIEVPDGIELQRSVEFEASHAGRRRISGVAKRAGIYRITARAVRRGGSDAESMFTRAGPLIVEHGVAHVRWGDLHGHSQLSDGTGTPDDYFTYARDSAGLDIVALTDHDHWGIEFLDSNPWMWQQIRDAVKAHNEPGRFVTVLGYEWTNWLHGHRHVLYFSDEGEIYSALDPRYENPVQLWDALEGQAALTFAHHSAGGPVSTNWFYPPHTILEPVTEVASVHGSSESADSPSAIYNPVAGNFVRDLLNAGFRVGFIGSGDSHDGHPGLAQIANEGGAGLAAIFTEDLTREGVLEALRARRTYATNGARIWLEASIDGHTMGSTLEPATSAEPLTQKLRVRVIGEGPLAYVDIIRSGVRSRVELAGELDWTLEREIPKLARGEYHYIRVVEESGALAWSSPIFAN